MSRKFLCLLVSISVILSQFIQVCADGLPGKYEDIPADSWVSEYINTLWEKNILNGIKSIGDQKFGIEDPVTRSDYSALIVKTLDIPVTAYSSVFKDVDKSSWYATYVEAAVKAGLVKPEKEGVFNPSGLLTREQLTALIMKAYEYSTKRSIKDEARKALISFQDDKEMSPDAREAVYAARAAGIISGKTVSEFSPKEKATRAHLAKMLVKLLEAVNRVKNPVNLKVMRNFDEGSTTDWEVMSGVAEIISDETSTGIYKTIPAKGMTRVLTGEYNWSDYTVETRFKINDWSAKTNKNAGLMARSMDKNNYYLFLYDDNSGNALINKKSDGKISTLASVPYSFKLKEWHSFKAVVMGDTLIFYINNKQVLAVIDTNPLVAGKAGLLSASAETVIDDFAISVEEISATVTPPTATPTPGFQATYIPDQKQKPKPTPAAMTKNYSEGAYFVAPNGSDSNPGTENQPWLTMQRAIDTAKAGSTVYIREGKYDGEVNLTCSGTADKYITFRPYRNENVKLQGVTITGSFLKVEGFDITGGNDGIFINKAQNVNVENVYIHDISGIGIRFDNGNPSSTNITIRGNKIERCGKEGMVIFADNALIEDNDISYVTDVFRFWGTSHTYRNNFIHDLPQVGGNHIDVWQTWLNLEKTANSILVENNTVLGVTGSDAHIVMAEGNGHGDWTFRNNVFAKIGSYGFILGKKGEKGIKNVSISNNTFVDVAMSREAECIQFNAESTGGKVLNNIFYNCRTAYKVADTAIEGFMADYNLVYQGVQLKESHAYYGDPNFMDYAKLEFRLKKGSPAINTGAPEDVVKVRLKDIAGNIVKDRTDIGAYEFENE